MIMLLFSNDYLMSPSRIFNYSLRMTTHFAKLTFGASTWPLQLLDMWLLRKDYDTICELTFDCAALVALFHRLGRWVVTMLYSLRKGHKRVWKLILYCSAFAAAGRIQCPHGPYQS